MVSFLATSDLHLTDRPQDEYRWTIFDFLFKEAKHRKVDAVLILGDVTDAKDQHSARLVNRLVREIAAFSEHFPIYFLKGNHDYSDEFGCFFAFLDHFPNVRFIQRTELVEIEDEGFVFVPHVHERPFADGKLNTTKSRTHQPLLSKRTVAILRKPHRFRLFHQTFKGSILSSGSRIEAKKGISHSGFRPYGLKHKGFVHLAGDVHPPQKCGPIHYCGAPHPINFGDNFNARVLYWDGEELNSLPRVTIRKLAVELNEDNMGLPPDLIPSDQIKITVNLSRERMSEWRQIRHQLFELANRDSIQIEAIQFNCTDSAFVPEVKAPASISTKPRKAVIEFAEDNGLPAKTTKAGLRILSRTVKR